MKEKPKRKMFSVCISEDLYNFILKQAIQASQLEGRTIGIVEITRRAIENAFPLPPKETQTEFKF